MTIRTRSTIDTNINTQIPDNQNQSITAANVRNQCLDINDSSAFQTIQASGINMSGVLTIDLNYPCQTIQPTGTPKAGFVGIHTTSRSSTTSSLTRVIFLAPNVDVAVTGWDSGWSWLGNKPSGLFANQTAILTLLNYGANETNIVAAFQQLSSG